MENQNYIMREITPLSERDCFYIADRHKTEFTYPIHCHAEYELNFTEHASGVRRVVGDSAEIIGDYDLVLITGKELEHVWEQHECTSGDIREITIQFSPDLFFGNVVNKNQFDSIRRMLERAQCGLSFPMQAIMKVYNWLDKLASEEQGFYAVMNFLRILYELSLYDNARVLSSSSFAKIETFSDSRRVQKVQKYISTHYQQEWAVRNEKIFIPCVGPGYIDTRVRPWNTVTTRDRENGKYYTDMFQAAMESGASYIGITSFNEWHEGTQIEPAVPFKSDDFEYLDYSPLAPDYYLTRTAELVSAWK